MYGSICYSLITSLCCKDSIKLHNDMYHVIFLFSRVVIVRKSYPIIEIWMQYKWDLKAYLYILNNILKSPKIKITSNSQYLRTPLTLFFWTWNRLEIKKSTICPRYLIFVASMIVWNDHPFDHRSSTYWQREISTTTS